MRRLPALLVALAVASVAYACNVPVFRYALERWRVDQSDVIVFHRGELTAGQRATIRGLEQSYAERLENINVIQSEIGSTTSPHQDLWNLVASDAGDSAAYVLVRAKLGPGRIINAWHGPLASMNEKHVLQSPARRELARRLLSSHAIVWLVVGSKDPARNQQAKEMLQRNIDDLAEKIQLPEGIGLPGSELHSEIPLLVRFSVLEIDRQDPKEAFLVDMLSQFQPEAVEVGEPLIVPVFGRGRALEVIPASDLSDRLMEDLTVFLSGACSCQVKERNPGFDLLLSVDWNTKLFGEGTEPPPEKSTGGDRNRPILLTIPPG